MKALEWSQHFSHYKSMGIFPNAQGQLTHKSFVQYCLISNPSQDFMVVLVTCKNKEEQIKNDGVRVVTRFSPLQPYGSYLLPWKPEFWHDLAQNLMESIPHPNDASDEIWLRSASWSQRYSCLKVWTDGRMYVRTPTRLPSYKLTLSLRLWWAKKMDFWYNPLITAYK